MKTEHKLKILFIMPSMGGGGAERVLINLLNLLNYDAYEVKLIVIMNKGKLWEDIPKDVNKISLHIHPMIYKTISYTLRIFHLNLFFLLGHNIKGNYDIGISFMDSILTELLFLKKLNLKRKMTVIHSSYKSYKNRSKFFKGSYKKLISARYDKLDNIICVSDEAKEEFIDLFGQRHKTQVIYNPLNVQDIINKANEPIPAALKKKVFHFVAVGSLIPVKGYELLIKACLLLKNKSINFHLHILGDGRLQDNLIYDLKLENHITLHGFKQNPYIWIKNADAFIMSSKVEGLPTVLCESLVLQKPVIAPNVPGCREVIGHGEFGLICERNELAFSKAMTKFIQNPKIASEYEMKAVERSKIFSDKVAIKKYQTLFHA